MPRYFRSRLKVDHVMQLSQFEVRLWRKAKLRLAAKALQCTCVLLASNGHAGVCVVWYTQRLPIA